MSKHKKIFAVVAAIFLLLLVYASYDISKRTTFPGSKSQLKERLQRTYGAQDSLKSDSLGPKSPKN
jgi:hypothetical protein